MPILLETDEIVIGGSEMMNGTYPGTDKSIWKYDKVDHLYFSYKYCCMVLRRVSIINVTWNNTDTCTNDTLNMWTKYL